MKLLPLLLVLVPWLASAQAVVPNRRMGGSPPTASLKVWLDANVLTGANDSALSPWNDISGNANNLNAAAGTMLVKTASQAGRRTVRFNNGVGGRTVGPSFVATGPWTVVCGFVMDSPASGAAGRALQMNTGNFGLGAAASGTTYRLVWVNGGTVVLTTSAAISTPRVHVITAATTPVTRWIIGNYSFLNSTNAGPPGTLFSLGQDTIGEPMNGNWFEFLMYDRVLTGLEIDQCIRYMNSKWQLTP